MTASSIASYFQRYYRSFGKKLFSVPTFDDIRRILADLLPSLGSGGSGVGATVITLGVIGISEDGSSVTLPALQDKAVSILWVDGTYKKTGTYTKLEASDTLTMLDGTELTAGTEVAFV